MPGNEIPKLLEEADNLFKDQKFKEAQQTYETLVGMDPSNPKVICGLLRCLVQLKKYDDATEMMESLDDETLKNEEIAKIYKLLSNIGDNGDSDIEDLKSLVINEPNNKDKRFELAKNYLSSNNMELGFKELLIIYEQDSKWNDEAAKKKLLEYFDILGFADPNVVTARKQLSKLMFK
jgi:putative thioredoxin